jgi:precorrin-8X/cobalt-precorrin-8 methylmutase
MDYLRDPQAIYAKSFATILAEADLHGIPVEAREIALRVIHACGMADIAGELRITPDFADSVRRALLAGKPIFVDVGMVRHGIIASQLPHGVQVICTLNHPKARQIGRRRQTTRSAAAVELWRDLLEGAIVAVGNAPTALFALIEMIDSGGPRPAAIAAFPVGFVGAVESKAELVRNARGVPFATLLGRRGGSAMAAAAINAAVAELET